MEVADAGAAVGYIPFSADTAGTEARWLAEGLSCEVHLATEVPTLNIPAPLPPLDDIRDRLAALLRRRWIVAEGPAGFLWAALLRAHGFAGGVTVLPFINPRRWSDLAAIAVYRRFADRRDRIFLGSTPSARIYRALGVNALVGEPFGIDGDVFRPRAGAAAVLEELGVPPGPVLLFAGRAQPDKDLYRLLFVALRARLLFPELQVVVASHVIDEAYIDVVRRELGPSSGVTLVLKPNRDQLADLYSAARVFVTAALSHFETFGRAPAEALACGTPAIAPRYDGFAEVLDQPGGTLVDVAFQAGEPVVREHLLQRAIYERLSAPDPVPSAEIAAAAHRRFARATTIRLLDHVRHAGPEAAPDDPLHPAPLRLPDDWQDEFDQIARLSPSEALLRTWRGDAGDRLGQHDPAFVSEVRRQLCCTGPRDLRMTQCR